MSLHSDIDILHKITEMNTECYCPDGISETWYCRSCFASGILSELSSIAYDSLREFSKQNSDIVK